LSTYNLGRGLTQLGHSRAGQSYDTHCDTDPVRTQLRQSRTPIRHNRTPEHIEEDKGRHMKNTIVFSKGKNTPPPHF
jgi:hypothetical protein